MAGFLHSPLACCCSLHALSVNTRGQMLTMRWAHLYPPPPLPALTTPSAARAKKDLFSALNLPQSYATVARSVWQKRRKFCLQGGSPGPDWNLRHGSPVHVAGLTHQRTA
jgi:hypothetical protein